MSQPVAWIARVHMDEAVFKKLLRSEAIGRFAAHIEAQLSSSPSIFYVFRYLKKEAALFACFYFHHGDAQSLQDVLEVLPIQALAGCAGAEGYLVSTLDALNPLPGDLLQASVLQNGEWQTIAALPDTLWHTLNKDMQRYFFKETERDFAISFAAMRIVDKAIVKRCQTLAEARRVREVLSRLDQASFLRPLHLFADYYYNGQYVYHKDGEITLLKELDPHTLVQTPYGAADARHVVIGKKLRHADPATFKVLQKSESVFYLDRQQVFDSTLQPIEGAEAASFKQRDEFYCEDAQALYFMGLRLPKSQLGQYRFHPGAHYLADKLLQAENAVWLGATRLAVDAASFRLLQTEKRSHTGYGAVIYLAEDKDGAFLLFNEHEGTTSQCHLLRTPHPEQALARLHANDAAHFENRFHLRPPSIGESDADFQAFERWMETCFDDHLGQQGESLDYQAISTYFQACCKREHYTALLLAFGKFAEHAWHHPRLFQHSACAYVALGRQDEALAELRKAVDFGHDRIDSLFSDYRLSALFARPDFIALKNHAESPASRRVSLALLRVLTSRPEQEPYARFAGPASRYCEHFDFPDALLAPEGLQGAEAQEYTRRLQQVFDRYLLQVIGVYKSLYNRYKQHASLHPQAHYCRLLTIFRNAHGTWGGIDYAELAEAADVIQRLRASLADPRFEARNAAIQAQNATDDFWAYALTVPLD